MAKILVVDDEQKIRKIVKLYLERAGFSVHEAEDGPQALDLFRRLLPDLVILDLMLPGLSGEQVCSAIRQGHDTPIIMLTAKVGEEDRVAGLECGADDYVLKPFSPKELVARVNAVLRRSGRLQRRPLASGDGEVKIDPVRHETLVKGQAVELTPTEYRLLALFLANPGTVFSRGQLAEQVLGTDYDSYEETIYAHIKNLRKKISAHTAQRYIDTVYGIGYRWLE